MMSVVETAPVARQRPQGFALDIVGIGALNLDYIATSIGSAVGHDRPPLSSRIEQLVGSSAPSFEWGGETFVEEQIVYDALEELGTSSLDAALGGSGFNAIFALAQMQLDLRLGYVGVAGRMPIPGLDGVQQLERLGVDHHFVHRDATRSCGICLSLIEAGERTLLTHTGANSGLADLIEHKFDDLAAYLASARAVHVTSFLDPVTPGCLLRLLRRVKELSPSTLLSFDPGHAWSVNPPAAVEGILALTDYLLVNYREFQALGLRSADDPDDMLAARLLPRCADNAVVVVKRYDGILAFREDDDEVISERFAQAPLAQEEIRDATGSGDVFAAGLLAVITSDRLQVELGALLGMRLARHKLRHIGSQGHSDFADITERFIQERATERHERALPRGVFVAHGGDPQWRSLKEFVERECDLPVYAFESDPWGSRQVTEALDRYLERCSFAVCVLTAEDLTQDERKRARQNVIHEAGLFQGRYGFERVMLLVEDGCEVAPSAGLTIISFPHGCIETTFWRLQKMIGVHGFSARD